ncbi:hypothetical protein JCM10213_001851 [Rhodosporidiobolus nylandii]
MAFSLTGTDDSAAKPSTRSRKPAAGASKGKSTAAPKRGAAAGKGKGKKAAPPAEEEEGGEDEDELMAVAEDDDEDEDDLAAEGETVIVPETQFDEDEEDAPPTSKGKGGRKAPAKKAPAAKKGAAATKKSTAAAKKEKPAPADIEKDEVDAGVDELGEVKQSAKEKRLQAQLDATKKALSDLQASFKKLSELRTTRSEEAELRLREIADERQEAAHATIQTYKTESDALRSEISALQETAFASPRSKAARLESARVRELEEENALLAARVEELEKQGEEDRSRAEREAEEREQKWEREVKKQVRATEERVGKEAREYKEELDALRTELAAEVAHSKDLNAKLKSAPSLAANSSSASLNASGGNTSVSGATAEKAKLQDEIDRLQAHLALNEDLTGFAVHTFKQEEQGAAYTCMLNDAAGQTGGLNFKLTFHADQSVGYKPDVEEGRDDVLLARLPQHMKGYMRFEADRCAEWFKLLFNSVNKAK